MYARVYFKNCDSDTNDKWVAVAKISVKSVLEVGFESTFAKV